jgi:hypothetical protein
MIICVICSFISFSYKYSYTDSNKIREKHIFKLFNIYSVF